MHYIYKALVLVALFISQSVFADGALQNDVASDKSCAVIAKACAAAGFVREKSETKGIWSNCMEPILLGKTVLGVKVDSSVVKLCRVHKIAELQAQLQQFMSVK